jgi:DNA-binding NarL/FixJ family response regulator
MPGEAAKDRSGAPGQADRPRVLIVDDHALMLEYAARTLETEFVVAGRLRDVRSLMNEWAAAQPDLIVLDVSLTDGNGFEAVGRLRACGCGVPVVFLSVHEGPEFVRAAWEAGGIGYVAKRDLRSSLVSAVRAALRGRRYVSASNTAA